MVCRQKNSSYTNNHKTKEVFSGRFRVPKVSSIFLPTSCEIEPFRASTFYRLPVISLFWGLGIEM